MDLLKIADDIVAVRVVEGETYCVPCWNRTVSEWVRENQPDAQIEVFTRDDTQDGEEWVCFECFEAII